MPVRASRVSSAENGLTVASSAQRVDLGIEPVAQDPRP
jgi:hypothetical protein